MGGVKWPADKVERWPISRLQPYAKNARVHSEAQIEQIAAAIREWGWTIPILADEKGIVIAGHGRLEAAKRLELDVIPVIVARGWTAAQRRAYTIADNKLALNATWDDALLRVELKELEALSIDLQSMGFTAGELAELFADKVGLRDPDEVPAVETKLISVAGDAWVMGDHRIVCGDATNAESVRLCLGDRKPVLMATDPPYGVEYDPMWRTRATGQKVRAKGLVENDHRFDWREAWMLYPGPVAYVWHAGRFSSGVQQSLEAADFEIRSQIIWVKDRFALSRGHYHWRHEPCWYAVRKGSSAGWHGGRKKDTVWRIANVGEPLAKLILAHINREGAEQTVWEIPMTVDDGSTGHGTQKPVECMRRPIENNSRPGDVIYEPFSGSGTTLIAAEMMSRSCCAIELSPAYVDVAVRRWQNFTGKVAHRERDGVPFDEASAPAPKGSRRNARPKAEAHAS